MLRKSRTVIAAALALVMFCGCGKSQQRPSISEQKAGQFLTTLFKAVRSNDTDTLSLMISDDIGGEERSFLLLNLNKLRMMRISRITPVEQADGLTTFQVDFTPWRVKSGKQVSAKVLLDATGKRLRLYDVRLPTGSGKK